MDEQIAPQPTILPPQETPEMYGVVNDVQPPSQQTQMQSPLIAEMLKKFIPFIAIFGVLLILFGLSSFYGFAIWDFIWPIVIVVVGILIVLSAIYNYTRRRSD